MSKSNNPVNGRCACGRKWVDIRHVDETYLGSPGYAHDGNLNMFEVNTIKEMRRLEELRLESAMKEVGV